MKCLHACVRACYLFLHRVNRRCDKCPRSLSPLFLQSTRGGDSTSQHLSDAPGKERSESSAMYREVHMGTSPTSHPSPDFPRLSCRGLLMRGYQMSNMDFVSLFLFLIIVSISDIAPTELSQILNVQSIPTRTTLGLYHQIAESPRFQTRNIRTTDMHCQGPRCGKCLGSFSLR